MSRRFYKDKDRCYFGLTAKKKKSSQVESVWRVIVGGHYLISEMQSVFIITVLRHECHQQSTPNSL